MTTSTVTVAAIENVLEALGVEPGDIYLPPEGGVWKTEDEDVDALGEGVLAGALEARFPGLSFTVRKSMTTLACGCCEGTETEVAWT